VLGGRDGLIPTPLRFTSCQAPIAEAFAAAVARQVGEQLAIAVEFVDGIPWQERLFEFDAGRIHVCWMCGLPYVWRADGAARSLEPLAAVVMAGARYADQPVYFSDVVVARDSPWSFFSELGGTSWAYNEDTSHSGYNATRHRLAQMGRGRGFFGKVVAAGSHEASLRLLLAGEVDATALDSSVLDLLRRRDPSLEWRLRILDSFGPSPSPPWVAARTVPGEVRDAVREALLALSSDPRGRAALRAGLASRFAPVADADYDPIRRMARESEGVLLSAPRSRRRDRVFP
jgi:phosphonate transport system substrate-binding protein